MNILKRLRRAFSGRSPALCSALSGRNNNPIYVAYYPHTQCDCYKVDMPFSKYRRDTLVLCEVSKGLPHATRLAKKALADHIAAALREAMPNKNAERREASAPAGVGNEKESL